MNSIFILFLGIIFAFLGYYGYARYVDRKIIQTDLKRATPARLYMDGVDFLPTSKHVLFGYQFKSIAAIGPVVGPIIAIQWGWLPALLWLLCGVLFIGWLQDYLSAIMAMRCEGQTFGALCYRQISPRGRLILLSFIFFYLLLIVAAFGDMVAKAMTKIPSVSVAIFALIVTGVLAGYMIYRRRIDILLTTFLMVILSLFGIWLGTKWQLGAPYLSWVLFALLFSYLGAVLPIWSYAQPINYISFYLVFLGIICAALGVIIGHPKFSTAAFTSFNIGLGPLWPILFVTLACGAISGWHSLVSSSGSARQLEAETDTCYVTAGAMFMEMILAILALIIAIVVANAFPNLQAYGENLKTVGPGGIFALGMSNLLNYLGIPAAYGKAFAGAIFVILAITVMQLVVRFMRLATSELVGDFILPLRNIYLSTFLCVILGFLLIYTGTFQYIWILFGGSNQLMAALALMLISVWLMNQKKPFAFTFAPMLFMLITTIAALGWTAFTLLSNAVTGKVAPPPGQSVQAAITGNFISGLIGIFLIIAALILSYDGFKAFFKLRKGQ